MNLPEKYGALQGCSFSHPEICSFFLFLLHNRKNSQLPLFPPTILTVKKQPAVALQPHCMPTLDSPMSWPKRLPDQHFQIMAPQRLLKIEHQLLLESMHSIPSTADQVPHIRPPIYLMQQPDRFILLLISAGERLPDINLLLSQGKEKQTPCFSITLRASCHYFRL